MITTLATPDETTVMNAAERETLARFQKWSATGIAYALEHGTRPSTIGSVLASNPLAMLAWCVFVDSGTCTQTDIWQDRREDDFLVLVYGLLPLVPWCLPPAFWQYDHGEMGVD